MNPTSNSRRLVLVGAGHTHLHIIRAWRRRPIPGVELVVVSAFPKSVYSGMLPATLAGLHDPEDMQIDLHRLTAGCGIVLIVDEAVGLDPESREIRLAGQTALRYYVASIGIGSRTSGSESFQDCADVIALKPIATAYTRISDWLDRRIASRQESAPPDALSIAIVGAGAAGVEVALCLDARLRRRGIPARVHLVDEHREILRGYSSGAIARAGREAERRGIGRVLGGHAAGYSEQDGLLLRGGGALPADLVILATRAAPPQVLEDFKLPKTADGFLAVRPTLQTTAAYPVFAVGDTAGFVDHPVPKAGVYAVREAPILWRNLQNIFAGRPLETYRPQHRFLSLLCSGDRRALLDFHGMSAHSRWAWWLKDWIDRRFVRQYQRV